MVEPIDPFQRGELDGFKTAPRSTAMNDLSLVKAVDRFGESIVVGIANASDRWLDPCVRQAFRISDRDILAAAVAVVDEAPP